MPKTIFLQWDTSKINKKKKNHISTHRWPDEVDHFYVSIVIQILTRKEKTNKRQKKQKVKSVISRTSLPTEAACLGGGGVWGSGWVHLLYLLMASTRSTWCSAEQCCSVAATELSALRTHTVRKQLKHLSHYSLSTSKTHSGENKTFKQSRLTKTEKRKIEKQKPRIYNFPNHWKVKLTYFAASLHECAKSDILLLELRREREG